MSRSGKVALMIVEDDVNIRILLEAAARRSGLFEPVQVADNGQSAWDVLTATAPSQLPDLIVSDLVMPHMTGLDLIRAVKHDERTRNIPIAIITSSDTPRDRTTALAAGACSFVPKPFGVDELTRVLAGIRESCVEVTSAAAT
jgi:CheY-like chemotaxis protein